jgi:CheY-like chemotaxis protein
VPLVLAIEPDLRQATILKRIVREKVHADVSVVDSPDAAIGAIRIQIPDVLLLSALLSPRDEDELIAHLRTLDAADHIQTHTIPQLASTAADQEDSGRGRGIFGVFRRKKDDSQQTSGCDPELFAEEISAYLQRAAEKKAENAAEQQSRQHQLEYLKQSSAAVAAAAERHSAPPPAADSEPAKGSWASPFEWKPATRDDAAPAETAAESAPYEPERTADIAYDPAALETAPANAEPLVDAHEDGQEDRYDPRNQPVHYEEAATTASIPEPIPVYEEPAPVSEEPLPAVASDALAAAPLEEEEALDSQGDPEPQVAIAAPMLEASAAATIEPVAAAPAPRTVAALRLAPLAMWARSEGAAHAPKSTPDVEEPRTVSDELRNLISGLAVPPHVAGVSYARGCRIRRVRVPGGKDRRRGETPGPVILSKRALEEARTANPNS